jgi:mono/diheme cytochrome c family protein
MTALRMSARSRMWLVIVIAGAAGVWLLVYTGVYSIAADEPHTALVLRLMTTVRERSIANHANGIALPGDLADPKRIAAGAALYKEMCSGCHLAPGMERTEISQGLYPRAPELSKGSELSPEQEFWVIKHGIKMTGMAAWGPSHDDTLIWDMVAFLRKLPSLSPSEYQASAEGEHKDHGQMMQEMKMDKDNEGKPHK